MTPGMKNDDMNDTSCEKHLRVYEYSHLQELVDNLPYIIMIVLGTAIFLTGIEVTFWRFGTAGFYFLYGIAGAFWIIWFVCPYCHFFDTSSCPCGYGRIAAKLQTKKDDRLFTKKFKRHIPVIFPLWAAPTAAGGIFLLGDFSGAMLALVILFVVDSFLILPLVSKKYGCAHCPQKDMCPWMHQKG